MSDANESQISVSFQCSPQKSIWWVSCKFQLSQKKKTIYKILHKYLLIKPYKLQLFQTMKSEDIVIQHKFCRQILGRMKNDNLPTSFIFNKEKTFHSKMNQHNSCIWGTQSSCHHSPAQKRSSKRICDPWHFKGEGLWHFYFVRNTITGKFCLRHA